MRRRLDQLDQPHEVLVGELFSRAGIRESLHAARKPCNNDFMSEPVIITVAITGAVPKKKDNPGRAGHPRRAGRVHARGLRGGRLARAHPRAQSRRILGLGPGAVRPRAGRRAQALPGHDRAVLHRRARPRAGKARRDAVPEAGHGLARHRLGQLPDQHLRERARFRRGPGEDDAGERHQARGRGVRPGDALQRRQPGEEGPAQGPAAHPVRAGHPQRHAGAAHHFRFS